MTREQIEEAGEFMSSMRGRFIMGKALFYAVRELEKVTGVHREVSDIDDMRYLQETIFNFPDVIYEVAHHDEHVAVSPV